MEAIISRTAYELALRFQDKSDIPTRIKNKKRGKNTKPETNSIVEQKFQGHLLTWTEVIHSILRHVSDNEQAWRFIRMKPKLEDQSILSVTLCKDFIDFNDLLVKRRDIDKCSPDELGKICILLTEFQKEIEKQINREVK
jgi:hypothetical protein